jgi:RsiW-degrading membrane proteinase PrsW (M82 family)
LFWLWFWLKEDLHPEPARMITLSFLGGMLAVLITLPLQKIAFDLFASSQTASFFVFATLEETIKFLLVYLIALRYKKIVDEPVDDIIYLIVAALGFVTFENTLFLIEPIKIGNLLDMLITGNLRFMGASLVHIISSATVGVFLGFAFYGSRTKKTVYALIGLLCAIVLHSSFNLLIINEPENYLFYIFGGVWTGVVVLLLIFEKVKKITNTTQITNNTEWHE